MAQISANVLQSLSDPFSRQGMFQLGQAIGGIPGQFKEKKRKDQVSAVMQEAQKAQQAKNPTAVLAAAQKLRALGENEQANALAKVAQDLQKVKDQQAAATGLFGIQRSVAEGKDPTTAIQSVVGFGGTTEQVASAMQRGREDEQRVLSQRQLENLREAAIGKARAAKDPYKVAEMENATREELLAYLNPKLFQMGAGTKLIDASGTTIAEQGFKPETASPKYDSKIIKDADGNETLISLENGVEINRYAVEPVGNETREESLSRLQAVPELASNISKIENLLARDELPSGLMAQLTRNIGEAPAVGFKGEALEVEAQYQQIKNFLGLENIRILKELGGGSTGLGAVSNLELTALQNSIEMLTTSRSEAGQREALEGLKKHLSVLHLMAQGKDLTDAVNWNDSSYAARGYSSIEDENGQQVVFYTDPNGKPYVYDRETAQFTLIGQ